MLCNNKITLNDLSTNKRLLLGNLIKELQNVYIIWWIEIKNVSIENTENKAYVMFINNVLVKRQLF